MADTGPMPRGYLTLVHAAEYLDLPVSTLREYVRLRKLSAFKVGRRLQFRQSDLDAWMEQHQLRRVWT